MKKTNKRMILLITGMSLASGTIPNALATTAVTKTEPVMGHAPVAINSAPHAQYDDSGEFVIITAKPNFVDADGDADASEYEWYQGGSGDSHKLTEMTDTITIDSDYEDKGVDFWVRVTPKTDEATTIPSTGVAVESERVTSPKIPSLATTEILPNYDSYTVGHDLIAGIRLETKTGEVITTDWCSFLNDKVTVPGTVANGDWEMNRYNLCTRTYIAKTPGDNLRISLKLREGTKVATKPYTIEPDSRIDSITANKTSLLADNTELVTYTAVIKDQDNNLVRNRRFNNMHWTVAPTMTTLVSSDTTDSNGKILATLKGMRVQNVVIGASLKDDVHWSYAPSVAFKMPELQLTPEQRPITGQDITKALATTESVYIYLYNGHWVTSITFPAASGLSGKKVKIIAGATFHTTININGSTVDAHMATYIYKSNGSTWIRI